MTTTTDNGARTSTRIRVDMAALTLEDLTNIDKECWERWGATLDVMFQDWRQKAGMAVVGWYVHRRDVDPDFTVEDALKLPPSALEIVEVDPEASSNGTTNAPPPLLESGA